MSYINDFLFIRGYLAMPDYTGWGWRASFSTGYYNYSTGEIELNVSVYVSDSTIDNSKIRRNVEGLVSKRLSELEKNYPGLLEEVNPGIDIVISLQ